jgi:hypothetical protein
MNVIVVLEIVAHDEEVELLFVHGREAPDRRACVGMADGEGESRPPSRLNRLRRKPHVDEIFARVERIARHERHPAARAAAFGCRRDVGMHRAIERPDASDRALSGTDALERDTAPAHQGEN